MPTATNKMLITEATGQRIAVALEKFEQKYPDKILIEKTITENGIYDASSDDADGYSEVTVNISEEEREIPSSYTRLAYIESDGDQYIDTGVNPINGFRVYIRCCFTAVRGTWDTILGSQGSSGSTNRAGGVMRNNATEYYLMWAGTSSVEAFAIVSNVLTGIMVDMRSGKYYMSSDASIYNNTYNGALTDKTMYLFGMNDNGTFGYSSKARVDFAFFMGSDGNFIRKFYAVKRNSDNKPGLWESVNGVFYTNLGTGEFTMPQ